LIPYVNADSGQVLHEDDWASISMFNLYISKTDVARERIKAWINYFRVIMPLKRGLRQKIDMGGILLDGEVTFHRKNIDRSETGKERGTPVWEGRSGPKAVGGQIAGDDVLVAECTVEFSVTQRIEESDAPKHMDFATARWPLGPYGKVNASATQEEVLFSIKPELFVACLICERLLDNEIISVCGARQYSRYTGHQRDFTPGAPPDRAFVFTFAGVDPRCRFGIEAPLLWPTMLCPADFASEEFEWPQILVIDPVLNNGLQGFEPKTLRRELDKLFVGMRGVDDGERNREGRGKVSTGLWGCQNSGNDVVLRFTQQLMVASVLKQPSMSFNIFSGEENAEKDEALLWSLREHILLMKSADVTCADLWDLVTGYIAYLVGGGGTEPNLEGGALFDRYLKEELVKLDSMRLERKVGGLTTENAGKKQPVINMHHSGFGTTHATSRDGYKDDEEPGGAAKSPAKLPNIGTGLHNLDGTANVTLPPPAPKTQPEGFCSTLTEQQLLRDLQQQESLASRTSAAGAPNQAAADEDVWEKVAQEREAANRMRLIRSHWREVEAHGDGDLYVSAIASCLPLSFLRLTPLDS